MRTARAVPTPWLCRNTMISRTAFCSAQAARMLAARTGPIPSTSRNRSGVASMTSNTFSPKARTSSWRKPGQPPDHAGREVLLDALGRSRGRCPQELGFELLAMGAVIDPFARGRDPLAGRDGCGMADHRHEITMPASLRAQDAKAVLGIVVGDALDQTGQNF